MDKLDSWLESTLESRPRPTPYRTSELGPWINHHSNASELSELVTSLTFRKRVRNFARKASDLAERGIVLKRFKQLIGRPERDLRQGEYVLNFTNDRTDRVLFYLAVRNKEFDVLKLLCQSSGVDWRMRPDPEQLRLNPFFDKRTDFASDIEAALVTALKKHKPETVARLMSILPPTDFSNRWIESIDYQWTALIKCLSDQTIRGWFQTRHLRTLHNQYNYRAAWSLFQAGVELPPGWTKSHLKQAANRSGQMFTPNNKALGRDRPRELRSLTPDNPPLADDTADRLRSRFDRRRRALERYVERLQQAHNVHGPDPAIVPIRLHSLREGSITLKRPGLSGRGLLRLYVPATSPVSVQVQPGPDLVVRGGAFKTRWSYYPEELFRNPRHGHEILTGPCQIIAHLEAKYITGAVESLANRRDF